MKHLFEASPEVSISAKLEGESRQKEVSKAQQCKSKELFRDARERDHSKLSVSCPCSQYDFINNEDSKQPHTLFLGKRNFRQIPPPTRSFSTLPLITLEEPANPTSPLATGKGIDATSTSYSPYLRGKRVAERSPFNYSLLSKEMKLGEVSCPTGETSTIVQVEGDNAFNSNSAHLQDIFLSRTLDGIAEIDQDKNDFQETKPKDKSLPVSWTSSPILQGYFAQAAGSAKSRQAKDGGNEPNNMQENKPLLNIPQSPTKSTSAGSSFQSCNCDIQLETDYKCMVYFPNEKPTVSYEITARELEVIKMDGRFFWMDVQSPSEEDLILLAKTFHLRSMTVQDISWNDVREKCDVMDQYNFVSIWSLEDHFDSKSYLRPINLFIIIGSSFLITIHHTPLDHIQNAINRIISFPHHILPLKDWAVYSILDDVIDISLPIIHSIQIEVDSIDELVLILKESEATDLLRRMGDCRRRLTLLHRFLATKNDVLKVIHKMFLNAKYDSDCVYLVTELQDRILTRLQTIEHAGKTLSRSYKNYLASIQIELTQSSNRTNHAAGQLTALASIIVPLNIITGLWGMNVAVPGEGEISWFYGIVCFMLLALIPLYYFAKRGYQQNT